MRLSDIKWTHTHNLLCMGPTDVWNDTWKHRNKTMATVTCLKLFSTLITGFCRWNQPTCNSVAYMFCISKVVELAASLSHSKITHFKADMQQNLHMNENQKSVLTP